MDKYTMSTIKEDDRDVFQILESMRIRQEEMEEALKEKKCDLCTQYRQCFFCESENNDD